MRSMLGNTRGISTIALIILLIGSATLGAVLSYMWTVGYYVERGLRVPENITTITITNMTFPLENSTYFYVTVLNPTYSETGAEIDSIALVGTTLGVRTVNSTEPPLPYPLKKGEEVTFKCKMNWGELAGQEVEVAVFIKEGSGATGSYQTEFAKLEITDLAYDTSITINQFNVTIKNRSDIAFDVSRMRIGTEEIAQNEISVNSQNITFPYRIPQNESRVLSCSRKLWDPENGIGTLGATKKITVETLQGYQAILWETFSNPVLMALSNIVFSSTNITEFMLSNYPQSPHGVNLSQVTVTVGGQTFTVAAANTNATGYFIPKDSNVTIVCKDPQFNWDTWKGQQITIRVYTTQGFLAKKGETIP